jgi:hypothetical protein
MELSHGFFYGGSIFKPFIPEIGRDGIIPVTGYLQKNILCQDEEIKTNKAHQVAEAAIKAISHFRMMKENNHPEIRTRQAASLRSLHPAQWIRTHNGTCI